MLVDNLTELKIVGVFDRAVPNKERVVITIEDTVNMGRYGLMLGVRAGNGTAVPIHDNMLWFGDGVVNKGDWLFVYTGPGNPVSSASLGSSKIYSVYWQKTQTVLASPDIVPILFRVDGVSIPADPVNLPQAPSLTRQS